MHSIISAQKSVGVEWSGTECCTNIEPNVLALFDHSTPVVISLTRGCQCWHLPHQKTHL